MKIAWVHEWLVLLAGAEKILEEAYGIYKGDVYTLVKDPQGIQGASFSEANIITSFIQKLPWGRKKYRSYLPLFPLAMESFDMRGYDVVLSTSHAVAKGVLTNCNQLHICCCCSPMRYIWDLRHQYLEEAGWDKGLKRKIAELIGHYLRLWDVGSVNRVDAFIAISKYISRRIKKIYNRESVVIYPPVDVDLFSLHEQKEDYYLAASRMVPYKKIDLVVEAFSTMPEKRLVVIGDGPDMDKVKKKAGKNIEILGYQNNDVLKEYMQKAKAFVFAPEEDFGIIPIEAQACGTPVIAYGKGGALETVVANETGMFFEKQDVDSVVKAVNSFEKNQDKFDCHKIRKQAEKFSTERFQREFKQFIDSKIEEFFG